MLDIRRLTLADLPQLLPLRRLSLEMHPEAYGSSVEEEDLFTETEWAKRLGLPGTNDFMLGAFEQDKLVGICAFLHRAPVKQRHKGYIWGVFVSPQFRGRGISRQLLVQTISRAEKIPGLSVLQLSVEENNVQAKELYLSCGFIEYGCEMKANYYEGRFVNDLLLWKDLGGNS